MPPGIELVSADNFEEWLLDIRVLDNNPLYQNETYRLKFRFASSYPIGESRTSHHVHSSSWTINADLGLAALQNRLKWFS